MPAAPSRFKPAGRILSARFATEVPAYLLASRRFTGSRAEGRRYERRAKERLEAHYGLRFTAGPWLSYTTAADGGVKYCQPDGILLDFEKLTCICTEMKLSHCDLSWWQLYHLYIPILEHIFPRMKIYGVEVCKWFDPVVKTSGPVKIIRSVEEVTDPYHKHFYPEHSVLIYRGRKDDQV